MVEQQGSRGSPCCQSTDEIPRGRNAERTVTPTGGTADSQHEPVTAEDDAMETNNRKPRCYFCARPLERATTQRVPVCGQCPDSELWQAIWRQQHRRP
jgi:hypothetical protein